MKRLLLLLLVILSASSIATVANAAVKYQVVWTKNANLSVTANSGAILYQLPGPKQYNPYLGYGLEELPDREVVDYSNYEQTVIKKAKPFQVAGYASSKKQLYYDTYAVVIKDIVYLLPSEYVADNSLIEAENRRLQAEYDKWSQKLISLQNEHDSLRTSFLTECETQYAYYQGIVNNLRPQVDSIENAVRENYRALEQGVYLKWYNSLSSSARNAYDNKIEIVTASLESPNSAGGCDAIFVYKNKSSKTIKYLSWTGSFYNAVNDKVACDIRGYTSFTGKDTGPVESGAEGGGLWECVIYDWAADHIKIESVSITYMDGSVTTIGSSDIKYLLNGPNYDQFFAENGAESEVVGNASQALRKELRRAESSAEDWKELLDLFTRKSYDYVRAYTSNEDHKLLCKRIVKLEIEISTYKKKVEEFEKKNLLR